MAASAGGRDQRRRPLAGWPAATGGRSEALTAPSSLRAMSSRFTTTASSRWARGPGIVARWAPHRRLQHPKAAFTWVGR